MQCMDVQYIFTVCAIRAKVVRGMKDPILREGLFLAYSVPSPSPQAHPQSKTSALSEQTPTHSPAMNILQAAV